MNASLPPPPPEFVLTANCKTSCRRVAGPAGDGEDQELLLPGPDVGHRHREGRGPRQPERGRRSSERVRVRVCVRVCVCVCVSLSWYSVCSFS